MNKFRPVCTFLKNGLSVSFCTGFICGLIPNNISVKYNEKKYFNQIPTPLVTGLTASFMTIISPFLVFNYFGNFAVLDKFYDKYQISIERYHQYNGNNDKYAYPSNIRINIEKK